MMLQDNFPIGWGCRRRRIPWLRIHRNHHPSIFLDLNTDCNAGSSRSL
jgi:hypothetical protein